VRVQRCEGDVKAHVARFVATIELYATDAAGERRARDTVSIEVPGWDGKDYGQLAEKLSQAVTQLTERVVTLAASVPKK